MKTSKLIVISLIAMLAALPMHAQQAFQDLNFEQANPVIDPEGQPYPYAVTAASALPGWTVYLGTVQQTDVLQNLYAINQASVDIFSPSYPAAGPFPGGSPGTIDGNYTVLLQAGNLPDSPTDVGASIEQVGFVPPTAQTLEFQAYLWTPSTEFSVSFDGNNLTPVALGSGANYTLYGVNISSYEGQTATLEFTALFTDGRSSGFGLDDIAFSTNAVTPEPGIVSLTAMGGLLFGARKWFARRS
jgi:hypothetical protein